MELSRWRKAGMKQVCLVLCGFLRALETNSLHVRVHWILF